MSCEILFRLLEPWPIKFVLDAVSGNEAWRRSLPTLAAVSTETAIVLLALAIPVVAGLRAFAGYHQAVGFAVVGNRVLTDLRAELFAHMQGLSLGFHRRARKGDLLIRVIGDVGLLKEALVTALLPLCVNAIVLVAMLGVLGWMSGRLALAALFVFPLLLLLTVRVGGQIHETSRKLRKREGAMATTAAESLAAVEAVQGLGLEQTFAARFGSANEKGFREGVRGRRLSARLERGVDLIAAIGVAGTVAYGGHLVLRGALTPGDLYVVIAYLRRALRPAKDFAKHSARLARASAAGERVLEVMDMPGLSALASGSADASAARGRLAFERVTTGHEEGSDLVADLSFSVEPGERLAIVGATGAGKTTLLSLVPRLQEARSGRVMLDGIDLRDYELSSLRSRVAIVSQQPLLFAGSLAENIAIGTEGCDRAEVLSAVSAAGAVDLLEALPQGLDTEIGERGETLSAGQRQLVALCRVAMRRPAVLLLDEPTASLDGESARRVHAAIEALAKSATTLLVTHDLELAASCDRVLRLDGRGGAEYGSPAELLQRGGDYARSLAAAPGGEAGARVE